MSLPRAFHLAGAKDAQSATTPTGARGIVPKAEPLPQREGQPAAATADPSQWAAFVLAGPGN